MKESSGGFHCQSNAADLSMIPKLFQSNDNSSASNIDIHTYFQYPLLITNLKQICKLLVEGLPHQAMKSFDDFFSKNDISSSTGHIIHYVKGRIYEAIKDEGKATDAYNQSLKYNDNFEPAYRENAALQERCENYAQALRIYDKWSKMNTKRGEIFEKMGDICSKFSGQNPNQKNEFRDLSNFYFMKSLSVGQKSSLNVKKFDSNFYQQLISTIL